MKLTAQATVVLLVVVVGTARSDAAVLEETSRISLPAVTGRIDHLAADVAGNRLYVAALGNATVEVVDLGRQKVVRSITGFREPQGVLFVPSAHRLFVSDGGADHATILDTIDSAAADKVPLPEDGDNLRSETGTGRVWVGAGSGRTSALVAVDPVSATVSTRIALAGHPEGFQLEQKGRRIFVNVPTTHTVQVVDREEQKPVAEWAVPAGVNFPMAVDEASHRLFVGTRLPAQLLVYDTTSGRTVSSLPIVADTDDLFYDAETHRLYASGGEGFVQVINQDDPDHYTEVERAPTRTGARTSLFVPEWRKLFVAVPRRGEESAEVRVFSVAR